MEKQPDKLEDFTNAPLTSMSEPMKVEDAVASTLATPFTQPIIAASKSKAQKQREYRQRIAASRTPAEAAAARKSKNERQRKNRLRQAANLAITRGSLEATTTSSSCPKTRAQIQREYRQRIAASRTPAQAAAAREARNVRDRNNRLCQAANLAIASGSLEATTTSSSHSGLVHIDTQQQFTDLQHQTLATEPAETTVQPITSSDQIEVQAQSTWNTKWASSIMRFRSTFLDKDFGHACSVSDRLWFRNDLKPVTAAQLKLLRADLSECQVQETQDVSTFPCAYIKGEKLEVITESEPQYILGDSAGTSSLNDDSNYPEACSLESGVEFKKSEAIQCSVPYCRATSTTISPAGQNKITFHDFPLEQHQRAAWKRALGLRGAARRLPRAAVICSRHFLPDDFCVTASGSRRIRPGAVPSIAVQVCLVCLDTDSKLHPLSQLNLEEEYKILTGHSPFDLGSLQAEVCVHCAQRLRHLRHLRETSLRARALMTELLQTHGVITMSQIKLIDREEHRLSSGLVTTSLVDHYDVYVLHDEHAESGDSTMGGIVSVKTELDPVSADEHMITSGDNAMGGVVAVKTELDSVSADEHMRTSGDSAMGGIVTVKTEQDTVSADEHIRTSGDSAMGGVVSVKTEQDPVSADEHMESSGDGAIDGVVTVKIERDPVSDDEHMGAVQIEVTPWRATLAASGESEASVTEAALVVPAELRHAELSARGFCSLTPTPKKTFICDICQHVDTRKRSLIDHIKTHAEVKTYSCKLCKYTTPYKTPFNRHVRTHTVGKPHSCELCGYKCAQKSDLIKHTWTHTGGKPYSCELCEYKTRGKSNLKYHIASKHTGEKPFSCKICDYRCIRRNELKYHNMKSHGEERPFTCDICGYSCVLKSRLSEHVRTHTRKKPHSCDVCGFKCAQKKTLNNHLKTHTSEKPFSCDLCEFKCAFKYYLVTHMKIHTGEKPHKCAYCEYKCAQKHGLIVHMRTHTGEKPYSCTVCRYKCARKSSLLAHIKTHTNRKSSKC